MKKFGQRFGLWLALLASVHLFLNALLGYLVTSIFSEGAGSHVSLESPQIRYFPVRGRVHNVHLYHPSEGPELGYRAKEINVEISILALLRKKVILPTLTLTGSHATSIGTETGFIKVIEFLFQKRPERVGGSAPWHSFLTSNWSVWVQNVHITTEKSPGTHLVIGTEEFRVLFDQATFNTRDPLDSKEQPVLLDIAGTNMRIQYGTAPPLPVGRAEGEGTLKGGVLMVRQAVLTDESTRLPENRVSRTEGSGYLTFRGEERYDFMIEGDVYDHYLARLIFPAEEYLIALQPHLRLAAHIGGELDAPKFGGKFTFGLGKGAPLMVRDSCAVKNLSAQFAVTNNDLHLSEIAVEDVIRDGALSLTFADPTPVESKLTVAIDRDSAFLKRCIPAPGAPLPTKDKSKAKQLEPLSLAINEALADSRTSISVSGKIQTGEYRGTVDSSIYVNSAHAHSKLAADFTFADNIIDVSLQERGVIPQIQRRKKRDETATQTAFETQINSNVNAKVRYDFGKKVLDLKDISVTRYPADRIAARIAPFLSQKAYSYLADNFTRKSLLNASGSLQLSQSDLRGSGAAKIDISNFNAGPLFIQQFEMPLAFSKGQLTSPQFRIVTGDGRIKGDAVIGTNGSLRAKVSGSQIGISSLPEIANRLPNVEADFDVEMEIEGTLQKPSYKGELLLRTARIVNNKSLQKADLSELKLQGDSANIEIGGSLLNGRAQLQLQYPLSSGPKEKIIARLTTDRFPIDHVFPLEIDAPDSPADASLITAQLEYEGSPAQPLLGVGSLKVEKLSLHRKGVHVSNTEPLVARINDGRLTFDSVFLQLSEKSLQLLGSVDHRTGWDSQVIGSWDLGALSVMVPALEQFSGLLDIKLGIKGPLLEPAINGEMRLSDGSVSFPLGESIVGADSARGTIRFSGSDIELERFDARVGEGWVVGQGTIKDFMDPYGRTLRADFLITDARLEPIQNLALAFGGALKLDMKGSEPLRIGGEIEFSEALYEQRLNLAALLQYVTSYIVGSSVTTIKSETAESNLQSPIELDLKLLARSSLLVETDIAKADLRGQVRLFGPPSRFSLDGAIEVVTGVFSFGANDFDVITGEMRFTPHGLRLDPRLDIVAETTVGSETGDQHNIRLVVSNTLSNPRVSFTSDSGLSENEIVSLFGLGSGGITVLSRARGDRTFRELIDPRSDVSLQERFVGLTGFSEVQINSGLSETTGEFVPRVSATRPFLGKSNLNLQSELSGEQLSEIGVDYPLTPFLSLSGGWRSRPVTEDVSDTSGSYNFGLRFRRSFSGLNLVPRKQLRPEELSR